MPDEFGATIARRKFFRADDESRASVVEVEVCKPLPSPHLPDEYMCSFRIRSEGETDTQTVFGIDELQALQLALGYLKAKLQHMNEAAGSQLRWLGDETGDLGIRLPDL
jgi:hypothetical protein